MMATRAAVRAQPGSRASRGFILVELMVTVTILAILLSIAVPSFEAVRLSNRLNSYATALLAGSQLARSEAIKRNAPVTLCATSNGSSCSSSNQWESGWIVLSGTAVLQQQPAADAGYRLREASGANALTFEATGVGASQASITLCRASPSAGSQERVIKISATGRTSVKRTTAGSCPE